jgi:porin
VETLYTGEVFSGLKGGFSRGSDYLDKKDLTIQFDLESLFGLQASSVWIHGMSVNGGSISALVGDHQGLSNIEAMATTKIFEAWFQQILLEGTLSLRVGLYDLNSEFDFIDTAQLFLNSSHGIGPEFAQSGLNGPSIFPSTSLAVRAELSLAAGLTVRSALLDGLPGDSNPTESDRPVGQGVLAVAELEYSSVGSEELPGEFTKYALGGWIYSGRFDELTATGAQRNEASGNFGVYGLLERPLLCRRGSDRPCLRTFLRAGVANAHFNQFQGYLGAGLVYTGLVGRRPQDQIGLAVASALTGVPYRSQQKQLGQSTDSHETVLELTYRAQILPFLALQPNLQYVFNPGTSGSHENALVVGTRFEIIF